MKTETVEVSKKEEHMVQWIGFNSKCQNITIHFNKFKELVSNGDVSVNAKYHGRSILSIAVDNKK